MQLHNASPYAAASSTGILKNGRACLVVVAKGTYRIPGPETAPAELLAEQPPPQESDSYCGEPGASAPHCESDFAPCKPLCDVIVHAFAYADDPGRAVYERVVGLQIGEWRKAFRVIGARHWESSGLRGLRPSPPVPFVRQAIGYEAAYGGTDPDANETGGVQTFLANPVGLGFHPNRRPSALRGRPLPHTEPLDRPAIDPRGLDLAPLSFGPMARNWAPRHRLAGTYDAAWQCQRRPFLPDDFDERYYQCAPLDQQLPHPQGGERIVLTGLSPRGTLAWRLPTVDLPMTAIMQSGARRPLRPVIDTLTIEPEEDRFSLVWRANIALERSIHEVDTLVVGTPTPGWERARMMDKPYVPLERLSAYRRRYRADRAARDGEAS